MELGHQRLAAVPGGAVDVPRDGRVQDDGVEVEQALVGVRPDVVVLLQGNVGPDLTLLLRLNSQGRRLDVRDPQACCRSIPDVIR